MAENSSVKSLVGGEVKVLNDMVGNVTVSAWREQAERAQQLDRLLELVAGTSELQTFLAGLNDLARVHNVAITTTKPGAVERFNPHQFRLRVRKPHQQPVVGALK